MTTTTLDRDYRLIRNGTITTDTIDGIIHQLTAAGAPRTDIANVEFALELGATYAANKILGRYGMSVELSSSGARYGMEAA